MAKTRCPQCSSEFERQGDFCPVCGYALTFVKELEEEPAEQYSERLPGEIPPPPPPPPAEEPAPTEPIVVPVIERPAPAPVYEPPPAEIIVVPPPAPAPRRSGLPLGARIGIGAVALVLVGGAVWAIVASQRPTSSSDKSGTSAEESSTPTGTVSGPTGEESYRLLATTYAAIGTLSAEIGKANAGDTYGGTGFAYEVFNPLIGDPDRANRELLVTKCEDMLKTITDARQELEATEVAAAYEDQKAALLGLYDLLEQRMQVLLDTAEVAVDQPEESAWRPILTPKSTDLRKQFESAYPPAAPSQQ